MNILELREKVIGLKDELNAMINNGQAETRELTEEENGRIAEIRTEIDNLEAEIAKQEAEDRKLAETNKDKKNNKDMKEIRLFNLVKGVAGMANLSDEERQYVSGQNITLRAADTTIQAQGEDGTGVEAIPEDKKRLDLAIRNASVLNKLGCTWFSNAVGDISLPKYSGSQVGWKGEIEAADKGEGEFSEVVLKPKRLTAIVDISKTFLAQTAEDAEAILMADLAAAVSEKLDETVFGAESGTTTRPAGLFYDNDYTVTGGTIGDIAYDDVLDLELGVEEKNGTDIVFVTSPNVKYALKGTQMASGLGMVYSAGEIDGYKAIVSNSVEKGGILALVPRDLAVASWNSMDITVDVYSRAHLNQVRLVVNYYVDAALRGDRIAAKTFSAE